MIDRTMLILDIFAQGALQEGTPAGGAGATAIPSAAPFRTGNGTFAVGRRDWNARPGRDKAGNRSPPCAAPDPALQENSGEVEGAPYARHGTQKKDGVTTVALVGYTNAGKSTLMNALTNAGVLAENKLFATLDPPPGRCGCRTAPRSCWSTRWAWCAVAAPSCRGVPLHLGTGRTGRLDPQCVRRVEREAQLHFEVAKSLLLQLGCEAPVVPVLNKCDLVPGLEAFPMIGGGLRVSAITGEGLQQLLTEVERRLGLEPVRAELLLPFAKSGLAAKLREGGTVLREEYRPDGLWMEGSASALAHGGGGAVPVRGRTAYRADGLMEPACRGISGRRRALRVCELPRRTESRHRGGLLILCRVGGGETLRVRGGGIK